MPQNFYQPVTKPYDPKQRLVGAIVLLFIIFILYGIFKLLLGIEGGKFVMPSEPETIITTANNWQDNQNAIYVTYRLPQRFIFLGLNGNPLQEKLYQEEKVTEKQSFHKKIEPDIVTNQSSVFVSTKAPELSLDICEINRGETQWYVQAASFKNEINAQRLVQQIKIAKIAPTACIIHTKNRWYLVHLPLETDYYIIQYQHEQLYKLLNLKGLIRKL